jgi:hypothetical protein
VVLQALGVWLVPALVWLSGFDSLTGDLGQRTFRFFALRVRRPSFYVGKLLALWATVAAITFVTQAAMVAVTLGEGKATLKQGKASLEMRILEPKGANFSVTPATQSSPQNENKDVSRLTLNLGKGKSQRIAVGFFPHPEAGDPVVELLSKWISAGKLK